MEFFGSHKEAFETTYWIAGVELHERFKAIGQANNFSAFPREILF